MGDEPIQPMTLGNMRQNGIRVLFVTCQALSTTGLTTSLCRPSARVCGARGVDHDDRRHGRWAVYAPLRIGGKIVVPDDRAH